MPTHLICRDRISQHHVADETEQHRHLLIRRSLSADPADAYRSRVISLAVGADHALWPSDLDRPVAPYDVVISAVYGMAIDDDTGEALGVPFFDLRQTDIHDIGRV